MPSRLEDYEVLKTVGSGVFGKCQKIRRNSDGKILAWKVINYGATTQSEKQMVVLEVNLLVALKHPNIVRYYDRIVDRTNSTLYIVTEYCGGGDLSGLIQRCIKERCYLEEGFILRIMAQLTLALKNCHRRPDGKGTVLHQDLKPANVFLDNKNNVKLGDFGLATILTPDGPFALGATGTPLYMCPEKVNDMFYKEKSDIWSLGCLLYELCALSPPFSRGGLAEKIRKGVFRRIPRHYSEELNTLISKMLHVKDYMRPSVEEILCSSLLADFIAEEEKKTQTTLHRRSANPGRPLREPAEPVSITEVRRREQEPVRRKNAAKEGELRLAQREKEISAGEELLNEKLQRALSLLDKYSIHPAGTPAVVA